MNKILLVILIISGFFYGVCFGGMLDDFEGGVNWGNSPWNAEYPDWNINNSTDTSEIEESSVTDTMNPEWKAYGGDFNGGPDYGYIEHDYLTGANNTSKSLKYTVTGGNKNAVQPPDTYGVGGMKTFYLTGLPSVDQTISVNNTIFTFKTVASTDTEITMGSSSAECAENIASAINNKFNVSEAFANTQALATLSVVCVGPGGIECSESASNISCYSSTPPAATLKQRYLDFPSLIADEVGAGNFYLYFGGVGGSFSTGLHDRFVVPASKRPSGSNRMTVWIKSPEFGSAPGDKPTQNINIGTRVNSQERFDSGYHAGMHYYHQIDLPASNYWTKVVITNNADHEVSQGGYAYTPDNNTNIDCPNGFCFNYMEGMSHFYIEGVGSHTTPIPFSVWIDELEIWEEKRKEDTEYIASRTASYLGSNQFCLTWTGRWGNENGDGTTATMKDDYTIYYSTTALNSTNFSTTGTKVPGTFSRTAYSKYAKAVFSIPNFDTNQTYYFAISSDNNSQQAGFIDYIAGTSSKIIVPPKAPTTLSIH